MTVGTLLTGWQQQTPYDCCVAAREKLSRLPSPLGSQGPTSPFARTSISGPCSKQQQKQKQQQQQQQLIGQDLFHYLVHNRQQVYQSTARAFTPTTEQSARQRRLPSAQSVHVRNRNLRLTKSPCHNCFGSAEPSDPGDMVRLSLSPGDLPSLVTVSRRRSRRLANAAKSKDKGEDGISRKRTVEDGEEGRRLKRIKTEDKSFLVSSTEKKVGGSSRALITGKEGSSIDPIVIDGSDGDDDDASSVVGSLGRSRRVGRKGESATSAPVPDSFTAGVPSTESFSKVESTDCKMGFQLEPFRNKPENDSTLTNMKTALENAELALINAVKRHEQEVEALRQKLDAAEARVKRMQEETEKSMADLRLRWEREEGEKIRQETISVERERARLYHELETEKATFRTAAQERDHLQTKVDNLEKDRVQSLTDQTRLKKECDRYRQERDDLLAQRDKVQMERCGLRNEHDNGSREVESARMKPKQDDKILLGHVVHDLEKQAHKSFLSTIGHPLRIQVPNPNINNTLPRLPLSPAPSTFTSSSSSSQPTSQYTSSRPTTDPDLDPDVEKKTENIRKTYIKVKRRYDSLHAVAVGLAACTRSMDLTSFGEFGAYCRRLRGVLEEEGG